MQTKAQKQKIAQACAEARAKLSDSGQLKKLIRRGCGNCQEANKLRARIEALSQEPDKSLFTDVISHEP